MTQAPLFSLEAVSTARHISTAAPLPAPLLLLFHGRDGAETVSAINAAVRGALRPANIITIASVVDLHHAPSLLRPALTIALEAAFRRAERHLPPNIDPADALVILPDWDGVVTAEYGMRERTVPVGVVAITREGLILETYTGTEAVSNCLRLARQLIVVEPIG